MDWTTILQGLTPKVTDPSILANHAKPPSGETKELEVWVPRVEDIRHPPVYVYQSGLTMYQILMMNHPPTWKPFFTRAEPEIRHACQMIAASSVGKSVFPLTQDLLSAFWLTPLFMLKAVIIGQDPYPGLQRDGRPKAIGISFATDRTYGEIPDSLKTVYRELEASVEGWTHPGHADLRCWARQGVLMYNTALTVEAHNAGSHTGFWKPFTEKLMEFLNENAKDCVFMLWGKHAQAAAQSIYTSRHFKLTAYHPSPRNDARDGFSFIGCNHFNLANIQLVEKGIHPIDWRVV